MKRYGYKTISLNGYAQTKWDIEEKDRGKIASVEELDELGSAGWRVISSSTNHLKAGAFNLLLEKEETEGQPEVGAENGEKKGNEGGDS